MIFSKHPIAGFHIKELALVNAEVVFDFASMIVTSTNVNRRLACLSAVSLLPTLWIFKLVNIASVDLCRTSRSLTLMIVTLWGMGWSIGQMQAKWRIGLLLHSFSLATGSLRLFTLNTIDP